MSTKLAIAGGALGVSGFTMVAALQNEFWSTTSSGVRLTIFASQIAVLISGIVVGWNRS